MKTYRFNISASGRTQKEADFVERFLDLCREDTAVSFRDDAVIFEFARQARSFGEAIVSAMVDIDAADAESCR